MYLPSKRTSHIRRKNTLHLCTATKEPHRTGRKILLHVRLGNSGNKLWFNIVYNLAVKMPLGFSFNRRTIRRIFVAKQSGVRWQIHSEALLSATNRKPHSLMSTSHITVSLALGKACNDDKASPHPICTAQQTLLKYTQQTLRLSDHKSLRY